jgi:hypothetical protein
VNLDWIDIEIQLPYHEQRVLAFIPGNKVYLPGKDLEFQLREVIVLHFLKNFYAEGTGKFEKHGPHFWQGEGNSNHFFNDVVQWMPIPNTPHIT